MSWVQIVGFRLINNCKLIRNYRLCKLQVCLNDSNDKIILKYLNNLNKYGETKVNSLSVYGINGLFLFWDYKLDTKLK